MNIIRYQGYLGKFDYDPQTKSFHGRVLNIQDIVTFAGHSIEELEQALQDSVEDYIEFCREVGKEPDKPFSGKFQVRVTPEIHRAVAVAAGIEGKSLNAWVAETLEREAKKRLPDPVVEPVEIP
jgi:predicted HicB family RNase H-like nuclease